MNAKEKRAIVGTIEKLLIVLLFFIIALVLKSTAGTIDRSNVNRADILTEGWYYIENGSRIELKLPHELEFAGESLVLYNDSLTKAEAGRQIALKAAQYDTVISCGDTVIYQYNDERFPRNAQMKSKLFCDGMLPMTYAGETLKIEFFNTRHGSYQLPQVYIGSTGAILLKEIEASALLIGIALVMLALSTFAIGAGLYMKRNQVWNIRFVDAAFFLIICSIWCITDSGFFQQYFQHYEINSTISFFAFMLLAVPMIHFIKNTEHLDKYHSLDLLNLMFYANAIVQGILKYCGVFEFIDMLFVTHLLLFVGCTVITILIRKEYCANKTEELKTIVHAFLLLAASGVLALILYWSFEISYYSFIFEIGIVIFVILLLRGIIWSAVMNIRAKTEIDVLRRLAKEDRLTGLGNVQAFDEYIIGLQQEAATLKNALLIFIDINYLKRTNDSYGHSAGDELIIAAACCLKNVFKKPAACFRIGGDEFCVIIKNPSAGEKEWFEALEKEIQRYNHSSRYWLSVAKGCSYLRENDGKIKTISDWKYQADCKMYEDKKEKRRR